MKELPEDDQHFTLNALKRDALPLGTRAVSGSEHLEVSVRWIIATSAALPLPPLEGGEVLLLHPSSISEAWIRTAQNAGAVGMIMLEPLSTLALSAAQLQEFPVLQLPMGSRLRDVERSVTAYLLDREGSLQRRSLGISEQLLRLAADHADLEALVHELSRMIDKGVIVQDKRLHIHECSLPPSIAGRFDAGKESLEDRDSLPVTFQDRHKLPLHTTQTILQAIPRINLARLITPIVTQGIGRGYLSFVAPPEAFTELDEMVIQHAAVVCALEMARAKAISETEKRLRGDFLDSLMLGNVSDAEAVVEGDRYGHDMTVPHIAMVVQWRGAQHPSIRRLETLVNGLSLRHPNSIISRLRENEVRMFYKVENTNPVQAARERATELIGDARAEYPDARLAIGIGTVAARVGGWRQSYREGQQAVDLAHKLKSDTPLYIGDLGIYMFLSHPDYREDLLALRDSTIGNLISYEERLRSDLLQTLNAFFEAHGNHTATADALNVHRNTLTYRLSRITEITGLDLNQPDVRLAVQLALKIHRLLGSESA